MEKFHHRFVRFERAMQAAFLNIVHALGERTIYGTPLSRRVLIIGGRQLPDDVNCAAGDLEFQPVAGLDACPPAYAMGHHQVGIWLNDDGHADRSDLPTGYQERIGSGWSRPLVVAPSSIPTATNLRPP